MAEKNGKAPQMEEEQDLSEILRVRREKLKNLQDQGKNPYEYTSFDAKQHAQEIVEHFEEEYDGKQVSVAFPISRQLIMRPATETDRKSVV